MGYRLSTPINVMLAEAKEPRLEDRFMFLGCNFMSRALSRPNHMLTPILENILTLLECPTFVVRFPPPFLYSCYLTCSQFSHLTFNSITPIDSMYPFELKQFIPHVSSLEGKLIKKDPTPSASFSRNFSVLHDVAQFFTDGSKDPNLPFAGFAVLDVHNDTVF